MAQVNYEIDLSSPEYRNRFRLIKPRTIRFLVCLLVSVILTACCYALDGYRLKLLSETEHLKKELSSKTEAAAPLLIISAEVETGESQSAIAEHLLSGYFIKGDYLEIVISSAPPDVGLSYLAADAEGQIVIKGNSPSLQSAANFAKMLHDMPFIGKAVLTTADYTEETGCYFSIKADLKQTAGYDKDEN